MFGPDGTMELMSSRRNFYRVEKGAERREEVLMASFLVHSLVH